MHWSKRRVLAVFSDLYSRAQKNIKSANIFLDKGILPEYNILVA